jgi:hypothetical protein
MAMSPDAIPAFWSEPWRWAAPAWRREYGAPNRDLDRYAARLIYSEWVSRFGLPQRWHAPADARWVELVQSSPAGLYAVIEVLGHLALLRAGAPAAVRGPAARERWLAQALKYRDVHTMRIRPLALPRDLPAVRECGIRVLCAMARRDWPEAESRFAMLAAPDAGGVPRASTLASPLGIDTIDVSRCLSIGGAVLRAWSAEPIEERPH